MHPDVVARRVGEAHQDIVESALAMANGSPRTARLEGLASGEGGPGVLEVLTAEALATFAETVADLRAEVATLSERVDGLESQKAAAPPKRKAKT